MVAKERGEDRGHGILTTAGGVVEMHVGEVRVSVYEVRVNVCGVKMNIFEVKASKQVVVALCRCHSERGKS